MKPIIYMAPIRGITNCVYRNTYSRLFTGFDRAVVPFLKNCNVSSPTHKLLRDLFPERNTVAYELIPQLLTKRAHEFITACKNLHALGYTTVNWNLGCPHKRIRERMHGSGMLPHPQKILKLLDDVLPKVKQQLSLKVRLGSEDKNELMTLLPLLDAYPLTEIIIHPRTGTQMYKGSVDLEAFENCLALTKHPVVYNGDIHSHEDFLMLKKRFPKLQTWMIGRGAIINPFLIEEIKSGSPSRESDRLERYILLHNELLNAYTVELSGWSHTSAKMKEYWYYWAQAFENGKRVLYTISRTKSKDEYITIANRFFSKKPRLLI